MEELRKILNTAVLMNPKLAAGWREKLHPKRFPLFSKPHLWLLSSGTTSQKEGKLRFTALGHEALFVSAESVNKTFQLTASQSWLCPLPTFHIGGLSLLVRAFLSKSRVCFLNPWNPEEFKRKIKEENVQLTSLVPQQVYDLVCQEIKAPLSLRIVFVGGGRLHEKVRQKALSLGWPLHLSYGLTEACSQVATARTPQSQDMKLLDHVEARVSEQGRLEIKTKSLFSAYAWVSSHSEVTVEKFSKEWFLTEDRVEIKNNTLTHFGREGEFRKISGELVSLRSLEACLEEILIQKKYPLFKSFLKFKRCEKKEYKIELVCEEGLKEMAYSVKEAFNKSVMPFERIEKVSFKDRVLRSDMGKVIR